MTISNEKHMRERQSMLDDMRTLEVQNSDIKGASEGQQRLIRSVTGHSKNHSALLNDQQAANAQGVTVQEVQSEELVRNERIAKQVNRSKFMGLGENPPQLGSEKQHLLLENDFWSTVSHKNTEYLKDESVPPQIYSLIEQYRKRACKIGGGGNGQAIALMIDDFFGEANAILKDAQLREIARIRNENNVVVNKLKRQLEGLEPAHHPSSSGGHSQAQTAASSKVFIDNDEMMEIR